MQIVPERRGNQPHLFQLIEALKLSHRTFVPLKQQVLDFTNEICDSFRVLDEFLMVRAEVLCGCTCIGRAKLGPIRNGTEGWIFF